MSRLFIAEKPSLAQAVMAVLPGTAQRNGVATRVGDDYFVPLAGHALEQAMPDEYLPDDIPRWVQDRLSRSSASKSWSPAWMCGRPQVLKRERWSS